MKLRKLSEITPSPPTAPTNQIVGVIGGTTDALFSISDVGGILKAGSNLVWYVAPIFAGTIVGGSGYTGATYANVSLTGGTGSGAKADITVDSFTHAVIQVVPVAGGTGYIVGDVLSAASGDIGGGSSFTFTLTSIDIGNDSNDGLTAGTPFGSVLHAVLVAAKFDYQTMFAPTVNLAAGTYITPVEGLILPELLGVANGGIIQGAGYTTTTVKNNVAGSNPSVTAYGSFASWFLFDLTIDGSIQSGTDGYIQLGGAGFGLTSTTHPPFDSTLGFNPLQVAGGTLAVVNTNVHILQKLSTFGNTNNTSVTNGWGVCSLEIVNSTITLPGVTCGDQPGNSWINATGSPSLVTYTGNTVVNAGNYVGAQLISSGSPVNINTDNGTPGDFPGVRSLNFVNVGTTISFLNISAGASQHSAGIWLNLNGIPALSDIGDQFYQVTQDNTIIRDGAGIGLFARYNNTIKCLTPEPTRVLVQFDKTNDTTLADIPNMTVNVGAGYSYEIRAVLFTTSNAATGVKAAIGGTCTATSIIYEGETTNAGAIAVQTRATALGTAVGGITAVTAARIDIVGLITVNAAGTLTIQFAENAAVPATVSSVLIGSHMSIQQIA